MTRPCDIDGAAVATPPGSLRAAHELGDCASCGNPLANAVPAPVDECYCGQVCRDYDAKIGVAAAADWHRERLDRRGL